MIIDCDQCAIRGVGCADCVISVLLDAPPVVELAEPDLRAIGTLADAGLVPHLRLIPVGEGGKKDEMPSVAGRSAERSHEHDGRRRRQVS